MPKGEYRPRFQFDISEAQQHRVWKLFPRGLHSAAFQVILEDVLNLVEENGVVALAVIIDRKLSMLDIMRAKEKV